MGKLPDVTAGGAGGVFIAGTNAATAITTSFTTTFTGSLTGSVASVTGAVGSVTGNVGGNVVGTVGAAAFVTGNVGGNVTGSVGSVTGAVGSVTGNVGGNVTGSVGSILAAGIPAIRSVASGTSDAGGSNHNDGRCRANPSRYGLLEGQYHCIYVWLWYLVSLDLSLDSLLHLIR